MEQRTSAAREAVLVAAGALLFGAAFSYPVLGHLRGIGLYYDWDLFEQLRWVPVDTIRQFHQFPFWNPYKCGGIPMLANPHSRILTPFFLLHLLFGAFVGFNLEIPLHLAIGWSGGYVLARTLKLSPTAGVACGAIFMGSSWFYLHASVGHPVFLPAAYLPWILAFLWMSFGSGKFFPAAMAGALVALVLGEGGVYAISEAFLLAGMIAFVLSVTERNIRPMITVAVFGLFAAGFAAVKLIPTYEMMVAYPRPWDRPEATSLRILATAFFSRYQNVDRPHIWNWEFWEYGAYLGPIAAMLAAIGAGAAWRRALPWSVAAAVLLACAMGEAGLHYPWILLHKLPIFSSERVATRMLIPFTLAIGVLAAIGVDWLRTRLGSAGTTIGWAIVAVMILDFLVVSAPMLDHVVPGHLEHPPVYPIFRQYRNQSPLEMLPATLANTGSLNCYEYTDVRSEAIGVNQPGYVGEQYLLGAGSVTLEQWTPNVLHYEVNVPSSTTLVVNQNYFPSWRVVEGAGRTFSSGGLLAVSLPAGAQRITLRYRDNTFFLGLIVSIVTMFAALWLWKAERGRP